MITGSFPPAACGVGDYTARLAEKLRAEGASVDIYSEKTVWGLLNVREVVARIAAMSPDVVHIQYPTIGYGHKLGPQVLSTLLRPCVVTMHEVSQVHVLRRLSMYLFSIGPAQVIFTSDYERRYALKWAPWLAGRSNVIPIGSFISTHVDAGTKDLDDIVYFGLIRPQKGLEQVIRLARLAKCEGLPLRIRIIGSVDSKQRCYLDQLQSSSVSLPIVWELGSPEPYVSNLLSRAKIAYMPFPDGASERRSSLLAVLSNSLAIVSTMGEFTTAEMAESLAFAATPEEALNVVKWLMSDSARIELLAQKARTYAQRHDWESIATRHLALYQEVIQSACLGARG